MWGLYDILIFISTRDPYGFKVLRNFYVQYIQVKVYKSEDSQSGASCYMYVILLCNPAMPIHWQEALIKIPILIYQYT